MTIRRSVQGQRAQRGRRSRLRFAATYVLYLIGFLLVVDYIFFWRPFTANLRRSPPTDLTAPPHVDADTMRRLGSLRADRHSSFSNFAPEKGDDVIRLCAFGDSFTYGDEVADGHDFPAFLHALFEQRGINNVEVLNFGNPWYGFHQTYILWDAVGRRFHCDYVLLGPDGFQPERDTTFNHTNLAQPYYLHARYVLGGEDVNLIDVLGETASQRFDAYFGFVPRWRYLRYDRNPPAIVQALLGSGRTQPNIFYYARQSPDAEALATYAILLGKMANDDVQVQLLHSLDAVVQMARDVDRANLVAQWTPRTVRYPYSAPGGHYSAFGNHLVAEEFQTRLTMPPTALTVLDFEDLSGPVAVPQPQAPTPLSQFDRLELHLAGEPAGFLATASANPALRGGAATDLHHSKATALLAFENLGTSMVDAAYVPVSVPLQNGDELRIRIEQGNDVEEHTLGRVRLLDPGVQIGVAEMSGMSFDWGQLLLHGSAEVSEARLSTRGAHITILVGSTPILHGTADTWPVPLSPVLDSLRTFRVGESEYVEVDHLPASGIVTVSLQDAARGTVEVPLVRWHKRAVEVPCGDRSLPKLLGRTGRRGEIVDGA